MLRGGVALPPLAEEIEKLAVVIMGDA